MQLTSVKFSNILWLICMVCIELFVYLYDFNCLWFVMYMIESAFWDVICIGCRSFDWPLDDQMFSWMAAPHGWFSG